MKAISSIIKGWLQSLSALLPLDPLRHGVAANTLYAGAAVHAQTHDDMRQAAHPKRASPPQKPSNQPPHHQE